MKSYLLSLFILPLFIVNAKAVEKTSFDMAGVPHWETSADENVHFFAPGARIPRSESTPTDWNLLLDYANAVNVVNPVSQDIKELVRGLQNDPKRIFEFVRNHYDFQPYMGLLKGSEKTYMDRAGNDADLCELLATMLNEAGPEYGPEFVEGWMNMAADDLARWLRADTSLPYNDTSDITSWQNAIRAITTPLYKGGIYYDPQGFFANGKITFKVHRTLLRVHIGGAVYLLDPAYKAYRRVDGVLKSSDLAIATGYDRTSLLTTLGGTPVTSGYKNLDEAGMRSSLTSYTSNLVENILSHHRGKSLIELLGGHELIPVETQDLPFSPAFAFSPIGDSFNSFPSYRKHYMRLKFGTIDRVFATSDIASKRLYFTFDESARAHLWVDDQEIASEVTAGAADERILVSVDHPYFTGADSYDLSTYETASTSRTAKLIAISKQFAPTFHERWFSKLSGEVADLIATGAANDDRRVLSRSMECYGAGYTAERVGYLNLIQALGGNGFGSSYLLQDIGLTYQKAGYGIDWINVAGLAYSGQTGGLAVERAFFDKTLGSWSYFSSALEHGLIDQLQRNKGGTSTVRALSFANRAGQDIYYVTNTNLGSVRSQLVAGGWPQNTLAMIDADFTTMPDSRMLIHRDYGVGSGVAGDTWQGGGYWFLPQGFPGGKFIIDGGYHGGKGILESLWDGILKLRRIAKGVYQFGLGTVEGIFGLNPTSVEPVDLATGAYLSEHTDLVIGEGIAPEGINFTRSYNSIKNRESHELGFGWSHNWDVGIKPLSYFAVQFGGRLPVDTAAQIVAGYISLDIASLGQDDAKEVMASMLLAHWGTDELVDNVASLNSGHRVDLFARQPDGSYTSPPGVTGMLSKTGDNYSLAQRHGSIFQFGQIMDQQRLVSITDLVGRSLHVTYDGSKVKTVTDCWNRTITFNYDGDQKLASLTDSSGRTMGFGHATNGDLTSYTDPDGNTSTFVYEDHRITDWFDEEGRVIARNFYSPLGKVERQHSEGNTAHEWTFYWSGHENIERDPLGNQKRYYFDERGRSLGFMDAGGRRSIIQPNIEGLPVKITDPLNRYAVNTYDADLNPTSRTVYASNNAVLRNESFQYDGSKRLWKSTNGRGFTTEYAYNAKHQLIRTTYPDLKFTESGFNTDGTLAWTKDRTGAQTTYSQYVNGNAEKITSPLGKFVEYRFTPLGDIERSWDAKRNLTRFEYNNRRIAKKVTDATDLFSTIGFDGKGNPISVTDRLGRNVIGTYNALGKIVTETNALGKSVTTSYDSRDLAWKVSSPGAKIKETLYDPAGRVVKVKLPIGFSDVEMDDAGRPILTRNALSDVVHTSYDDLTRTSTSVNPRNESVARKTDLNGNTTEITNGRGFTTSMAFDSVDRPTTTTTPGGRQFSVAYQDLILERKEIITSPSARQITRHFNAGGQLDWIDDALGRISYTYDDNGNTQSTSQGSQTSSYVHADRLNRVTSYTDETGQVINYGHDIISPAPAAELYRTSITYPGTAAPVYFDRDKLDRLVKITDWAGRVSTFTYYDTSINGEDGELNEITRPNQTKRKHYYDTAGRLKRVDELDANGYLIARYDLTLDDVGKVKSEFQVPKTQPWTPDSWMATYNSDDQFLTHSSGSVGHDLDGNLTGAPGKVGGVLVNQSYGFNARNQLTGVSTSDASYTYNAEGHLKSRTVAGLTTSYLVNPVGRLSQILATTTGAQTSRFVYGLGLLYEERPDGSIRSYHFDYRGNTVALCAADGLTVTARAQYTPYGMLSHSTGTLDTPFQYNGSYGVLTDVATGLIHMRARWYSPYLKRFINPDPAGFTGGMNFYAFAANNPITFGDPSGLGPISFSQSVGQVFGSIVGKIWASPNTAIGLVWGAIGFVTEVVSYPFTGVWNFGVSLGHNAIQFTGHNLAVSAETLGNAISYSSNTPPGYYGPSYTGSVGTGFHEGGHTYQQQVYGPLFLPIYSIFGIASSHNPFEIGADNFARGNSWIPTYTIKP